MLTRFPRSIVFLLVLVAFPWSGRSLVRAADALESPRPLVDTFGHSAAFVVPDNQESSLVVVQSLSLSLKSITPDEAFDFRPQTVTISGSNFLPGASITLEAEPLEATFVNSDTLTATVPAGLPDGSYDLTVTNPDDQDATLVDAFTVLRSYDGTLGPWEFVSPLPVRRDGLAAVHAGQYLYTMGGYTVTGETNLSRVDRALINSDGTLGVWEPVSALTEGRDHGEAVVVGDSIYVIGGLDDVGIETNSVERAVIKPDGTLSVWERVAPMIAPRSLFAAAGTSDYLYALGGSDAAGYLDTVERAAIKPDGTLGSWEVITSLTEPREALEAVIHGNYLYVLGGAQSCCVVSGSASVERAAINPDGTLGPWEAAASMRQPRWAFAAVASGGYLYALGGQSYDSHNDVERAAIHPNGSLGSWEETSPLIQGRVAMAAVSADNSLYVLGGLGDDYLQEVERAEVSSIELAVFSPAAVPPGESAIVLVEGRNFLPPSSVRVGDLRLRTTYVSTRTLTVDVPAALARGWYTATLHGGDGRLATLANALLINGPLSLESITPPVAANNLPITVTIRGTNFLNTAEVDVRLGNIPLKNVTVLDSSTMIATMPANRAAGRYTLTIRHRHAQQASLPEAFTVLPGRDGTLGPWERASPTKMGRTQSAAVVSGNHIYVLGGEPGRGGTNSVERAEILEDGSLGPWQPERALRVERRGLAAVIVGDSLYVVGGTPAHDGAGSVERAAILADGGLGPWESLASTHIARYRFALVEANGYLYAIGGMPNSQPTRTVERAAILADGILGPWEFVAPLQVARMWHSAVAVAGYIYVFGGNGGSITPGSPANIERAALQPDGTLGPWEILRPLTSPRAAFGAVEVGDSIYLIGGCCGDSSDLSAVRRAAVHADGTLGPWQKVSSLTAPREFHAVASARGHLYALGGMNRHSNFSTLNSVERAPLSPPRLEGLDPLVIPAGATDLTATGVNFMPAVDLRLEGATDLHASYVSTTTLEAFVPRPLESGWYTATLTTTNGKTTSLPNALLVDDGPPTGSIMINRGAGLANSRSIRLDLSAEDALSSVEGMSFSNEGRTYSPFESFVVSRTWELSEGDGPKLVYARFRDEAGNLSAPASATIILDTTPPSGSVVAGGGVSVVTTNTLALELEAVDATAGVTSMSFSNNGRTWSPWQPYETSKSWTLAVGDGSKTVSARFRDAAGNSKIVTDSVILDTEAPHASLSPLRPFTAATSVQVAWSARDAGSGAASYDVQVRDGNGNWTDWQDATTQTSAIFSGVDGDSYAFRVRARDHAGHLGPYSSEDRSTTVDMTAPTLSSFTINGGALSTTSLAVNVFLSASDDSGEGSAFALSSGASRAVELHLSNDAANWSAWQPYAKDVAWSLSGAAGPKSVYARLRDAAGNVSDVFSATIELDTAAGDQYALAIDAGASFSNQAGVTLTIGARPATAAMQVSDGDDFRGISWEPYVSRKAWTLSGAAERSGSRAVYVRFRDVNGAISDPVWDEIVLDAVPPTGTVTVAGAETGSDGSTVTLHLSASDDASDVVAMRLSHAPDFDGVAWETSTTRRGWTFGSTQMVFVQFLDGAGNVSGTASTSRSQPVLTVTPSPTATPTATGVPANPTRIPSSTATPTATGVPANPTRIPTSTATPTATTVPATQTRTPTPSQGPGSTVTATRVSSSTPTATSPAASTATKTPTSIATSTQHPSATYPGVPTARPSTTPTPMTTATHAATVVPTKEPTVTPTGGRTYSLSLPVVLRERVD